MACRLTYKSMTAAKLLFQHPENLLICGEPIKKCLTLDLWVTFITFPKSKFMITTLTFYFSWMHQLFKLIKKAQKLMDNKEVSRCKYLFASIMKNLIVSSKDLSLSVQDRYLIKINLEDAYQLSYKFFSKDDFKLLVGE